LAGAARQPRSATLDTHPNEVSERRAVHPSVMANLLQTILNATAREV
jgi:hypothetical protein